MLFGKKGIVVSSDTHVYKRLFDLRATIDKMIVDGTRSAEKVADALQVIVDNASTYLRLLYNEHAFGVDATDGTETFKSSGLFTGGIYGQAVPIVAQGKPTLATKATVWEMILDAPYALLFGSLGENRKRWTEHQVVQFCRQHPDKLRKEGYGTFFEMEGDVVALVLFDGNGRLSVSFDPFDFSCVWFAGYQPRVVSLQQ